MGPLPNPYVMLAFGAALIASILGGYAYGTAHEARIWKAALAEQKAEAEQLRTTLTEKARAKEAADAESARNIDAVYQTMLADAYAGSAEFDRRLRVARRGASCGGAGSGQAPHPGSGADVAAGGEPGPGSADPAHDLRNAALELQRYAKACNAFAVSVGR